MFDELNKYEVTTHFMGQCTVVLVGERATGETYCIAHHVSASEGERTLLLVLFVIIMISLQKLRESGFAERKLMVDWTDTSPINV